jgi:hypothetical protein
MFVVNVSHSVFVFDFLIEQAFLAILPRVSQSLSRFLVVINNFNLLVIH